MCVYVRVYVSVYVHVHVYMHVYCVCVCVCAFVCFMRLHIHFCRNACAGTFILHHIVYDKNRKKCECMHGAWVLLGVGTFGRIYRALLSVQYIYVYVYVVHIWLFRVHV